jgi:hypothetical protein
MLDLLLELPLELSLELPLELHEQERVQLPTPYLQLLLTQTLS